MSRSLLMCSPEGFAVNYEINPWMKEQVGKIAHGLARLQWQGLFDILSGVSEIEVMPGDPDWPDLVFTANAGLPAPTAKRFILSNFRHPERQGEKALNRAWLQSRGWECLDLPDDVSFEGAGDALFDSESTLWLGHGFRTDAAAASRLAEHLDNPIRLLRLVNPAYYHLDTCFCPLSDGSAMYLPGAFAPESCRDLESAFGDKLIALTPEEGRLFCANAVEAGGMVVMNRPTQRLEARLESRGFAVAAAPLDEFMKSGGSAKCLTLRLDS